MSPLQWSDQLDRFHLDQKLGFASGSLSVTIQTRKTLEDSWTDLADWLWHQFAHEGQCWRQILSVLCWSLMRWSGTAAITKKRSNLSLLYVKY